MEPSQNESSDKGKSDVLTCASSTTDKEGGSTSSNENILALLLEKPWRKANIPANGFLPTMEQQGRPSPISHSCVASVTNVNYYTNSPANYQRKHSFQSTEEFDSGLDSVPEKIQKMSDDGVDKYSAMDIKSPQEGLKAKRYNKTAEALKMSGLMDITMKTAELLKKNKQLQKEMDKLKKDSKDFLRNVLDNPENHLVRDTYLQHLNSDT